MIHQFHVINIWEVNNNAQHLQEIKNSVQEESNVKPKHVVIQFKQALNKIALTI